jgi:lysophospholipase L1-like esterase
MTKSVLMVMVASATLILSGCGRPLEPTRPTSVSSPSVSPADALAPAVDWNCVAFATAGRRPGDCPVPRAVSPSAAATAAPAAPLNLVGTVSRSRVALVWQAPTVGDAPTSYVIEAGSAAGRTDLANFDTGIAAPSFTADNVPSATYFVRVRAKNAAGVSAPSNELVLTVSASGCPATPDAPTNLRNTVSGSTVVLTWTAPVGGCAPTSYVIQAGSVAGSSNLADFDNRSLATSFTATSVEVGQYYVRVRAVTASGSGSASNEVVITVVPSPLTATSFVAFGDSITAGESGLDALVGESLTVAPSRFRPTVLLPLAQRYPTILQQDLVARYRTQMPSVVNEGLGGEAVTDPGTLSRFSRLMSSGRFGVVLIMEGTNDLFGVRDSTIIPRAVAGLRQMVRDAKGRGIKPYLATIPPINSQGFRGRTYTAELVPGLNDGIRALAASEAVPLVDVNQGFSFGLLGIDGLHPNADGYARIADVFYGAIKSTLETAPPPIDEASHFIGRFQ